MKMTMDNTTMSMTMNGMHHNQHTPMNHMYMYFHFSDQATILFSSWKTSSAGEMVGSCIFFVVLAMLFEGLKVLREHIDKKFKRSVHHEHTESAVNSMSTKEAASKRQRLGMLVPVHWLQTLLHFIQLWISFCLMLVFMTFNVYLCLAVTVGGALGYFCFAWIQRPGHRYGSDMCH